MRVIDVRVKAIDGVLARRNFVLATHICWRPRLGGREGLAVGDFRSNLRLRDGRTSGQRLATGTERGKMLLIPQREEELF
jgi:hypothetical protein